MKNASASRPALSPHLHARGHRWLLIIAIVIAVLLLAIRFVGSPIATRMVNRKLGALEGFTGHVDAINLQPWRVGVEIKNLTLHERGFKEDLPLVRVKRATISTAVAGLLRGKIAGESRVDGAEFAVVKRQRLDGPVDAAHKTEEKAEQTQHKAKSWQVVLRESFPMEITRFEMKNSRARFVDPTHQPIVDTAIEDLHMVVTGLTNQRQGNDDPLPMKTELTGVMTGDGQLKIQMQADPIATPLRFEVKFEIRDLSLPPNNDFLQAYAGVDVSRGTFDVYISAEAKDGGYHGLLKPFFKDLEFRDVSNDDKSLGARIKESVINAAASLLKNDETQKVATETPFSGTFDENEIDLWTTVQNLLSNSFVRALHEGFAAETPSKD